MARQVDRVATVTAIEGDTITLETLDGWSRTVDLTGVPVLRGREAVTTAELEVGTRVRLVQRRAADGTWQVTRVRIVLATEWGTVTTLADDGFTLTRADGSTISVRVSGTTAWVTGRRAGGGLDALAVGSRVVVRGVATADGSMDATAVATIGERGRRQLRPGRVPSSLPTPAPSASPTASLPSA